MLFVVIMITPFILFFSGAYFLHYPLTVAALYAFNLALMYVVLGAAGNQMLKIHSQRMIVSGGNLVLSRKGIFPTFPMIRQLDLEIPLHAVLDFSLEQTRVGYLLTVQFTHEGKTMGVDLDLNPLRLENRDILNKILSGNPRLSVSEKTQSILDNYAKEAMAWKGSYMFSLLVLGLAMVIFFMVSVYLGTKVH